MQHAGKSADDAYNGGVMATCKTCRHYPRCIERSRMYPCAEYERGEKYGRNTGNTRVERQEDKRREEKKT